MSQRNGDWLVLKTIAIGVALLAVYAVGFCCGGLSSAQRTRSQQLEEQRDAVAPVLASDPAFSGVRVRPYDDGGWILLEGEVPTDQDKFRLMQAISEAIGRRKAENAVPGVKVKTPSPPANVAPR